MGGGEAVDLNLPARGGAGRRENPAEHTITAPVLSFTLPDHDEIPRRVRSHRGLGLAARRERVDLKLAPERSAGGVETPANEPQSASILPALPYNDEVSARARAHGGGGLRTDRRKIDRKLRSRRRYLLGNRPRDGKCGKKKQPQKRAFRYDTSHGFTPSVRVPPFLIIPEGAGGKSEPHNIRGCLFVSARADPERVTMGTATSDLAP